MRQRANFRHLDGFILGLLIAAAVFVGPIRLVSGGLEKELAINESLGSETPGGLRFGVLDANDDRFLTRDEIPTGTPALSRRYAFMDTNQDGRLSMREFGFNR